MGERKAWTWEEEEALLAGIAKYGGQWKFIVKDPDLNRFLQTRTDLDLKDKWINIIVSTSRQADTWKTLKHKLQLRWYDAMVFEALSTSKEADGSMDIRSLGRYFKERVEPPHKFWRPLRSRLARLVAEQKLEKIGMVYRIKEKPQCDTVDAEASHPDEDEDDSSKELCYCPSFHFLVSFFVSCFCRR